MGDLRTNESPSLIIKHDDFIHHAHSFDSRFDSILKTSWKKAMNNGAFNYKLEEDSIETKIISGLYGFVAQFNEKRGLLRRKPQSMQSLRMPFNHEKFNFTKIKPEEKLMGISLDGDDDTVQGDLIINSSPIEYCSSLLVPRLNDCLPQILTPESLKLAISVLAASGQKSLRLGFNSLGAAASVNHQHWHVYYFKYDLAIETTPIVDNIAKDWPIQAFAYELSNFNQDSLKQVVDWCMKITSHCLNQNIAHNLFLTRNRKGDSIRIFIWPRPADFATKNDMNVVAAFCEFSGFFICKTPESFTEIDEDFCVRLMKSMNMDLLHMKAQFDAL